MSAFAECQFLPPLKERASSALKSVKTDEAIQPHIDSSDKLNALYKRRWPCSGHHGLGEIGLVIGIHIGAMYLPSLFTGILVD